MRKRFLTLMVISAKTISLAACGKKASDDETTKKATETTTTAVETVEESFETEAVTETEAPTEAESETETEAPTETEEDTDESDENTSEFDGTYVETMAGKGTISISTTGDTSTIEISWAGSAFEVSTWTFSGTFDENGTLTYDNCKKEVTVYESEEDYETTTDYQDGCGSITIKDGVLTWDDEEEQIAEGSEFELI